MISNFKHRGLKELFHAGHSHRINKALHRRIIRRLDVLDAAKKLVQLDVPGFNFHKLKGYKPERYTIHVNGPWCITFNWQGDEATDINLENYH